MHHGRTRRANGRVPGRTMGDIASPITVGVDADYTLRCVSQKTSLWAGSTAPLGNPGWIRQEDSKAMLFLPRGDGMRDGRT